MPLQNRVDPFGQPHAVAARGEWMGNRGILHDDRRLVVRPWKGQLWITCRLEFNGRKRAVFTPGRYSELFFLDEATAFAAGHRPCGECRRDRYREFKAAFLAANSKAGEAADACDLDRQLHAERVGPNRAKRTFEAKWPTLPNGTMFARGGEPHLLWHRRPWRWSFSGYTAAILEPVTVEVLTPPSIVEMFRRGFVPQVHDSAQARQVIDKS